MCITAYVATSGGSTGRPKLIILNEPSLVQMEDRGGGCYLMPDGFSVEGGGEPHEFAACKRK